MIELLLKSSIAIGVALVFYKLVLQQESFFATNRLYLLSCLVLAFALPFISLPKMVNQQGFLAKVLEQKISGEEVSKKAFPAPLKNSSTTELLSNTIASAEENTETLPEASPKTTTLLQVRSQAEIPKESEIVEEAWLPQLSFQSWLLLLYFFGVGIFTLSLLFQLGCVFFEIIRSRDKIRDGEYIIVSTATRKAPCSFFRYIFIYPDDYDFETYEQIIKHEKTHIRLGHSFDLLFAELAVVVLWFNPLIWLFKREIEKNNEYQTDSILVEKEKVRKDQYQLNLLQIAVPNKPLNITTNYNQSLIKQRIIMMNAKRSTPYAYWKYTFLAPIFLGLLLLLNEPATGQEKKEKTRTEAEKAAAISKEQKAAVYPLRREQVVRERQNLVERERNAVREREQLQARAVLVEERRENVRERLDERAALAEARRADVRERVVSRVARRDVQNISFSKRGAQVDMTSGHWYSSIKNGKYCIEFRGSSEKANWNMSDCYNRQKFQKKGEDTFVMTNEVGRLELKGNLDSETGQGKYIFTENADFRNLIENENIADVTKNVMFHLFFGEMTANYVNFLKKEYSDIDGDDLAAIAIHGIKQEEFNGFVKLFKKHSNKKPNVGDVVGLKIHGVTESYVEELQKMGFLNLSINDIMSAKIHGVSQAYFRDLKNSGFTDLSMDEIITAKIHGVEPQTIKEMRALGARDLDKIVQLQIHDVSADYVRELQAAGLGDLSLDEIVSAKIHGLDAGTIKEIKTIGSSNMDFEDLISAQIHGVNAAFVKGLEQAGFTNLEMDKIVSARIHGVDEAFIKKAKKDGYNLNTIDKYISLKIHGSAMESLKNQ